MSGSQTAIIYIASGIGLLAIAVFMNRLRYHHPELFEGKNCPTGTKEPGPESEAAGLTAKEEEVPRDETPFGVPAGDSRTSAGEQKRDFKESYETEASHETKDPL